MIRTELSLEVSDTTNQRIMRAYDTSFYCDDQELNNYLVEILPVNKSEWIPFNVSKDFSLVFNSSNLHYKKVSNVFGLVELPDGIYELRQSFKPTNQTMVSFYHLRIVELSNKLRDEKDKLFKNKCDVCKREFNSAMDALINISEYIDAAKWAVEECHDKLRGKEMYDFARKLLEHYKNDCHC